MLRAVLCGAVQGKSFFVDLAGCGNGRDGVLEAVSAAIRDNGGAVSSSIAAATHAVLRHRGQGEACSAGTAAGVAFVTPQWVLLCAQRRTLMPTVRK
jgi:BRCT domain, a BRCA1 C-terminus domain